MDRPAFYVEVVLTGSEDYSLENRFPRLSWHCAGGFNSLGSFSTIAQRRALLGRYACHRVPAVGVDVPLIEPTVELSLQTADRILRAFETGYVSNIDVAALRRALAGALGHREAA